MRWAEEQRQIFIGDIVRQQGFINRHELINKFGISRPQASRDLQTFIKEYPNLLTYNVTTKRYEMRKKESTL